MCSQPDYCFLAELTVFPVNGDGLSVHAIAPQKQSALLVPCFGVLLVLLFLFLILKEGLFVPKLDHRTFDQRPLI